MQVRPSSAPRFLACPSSVLPIDNPVGGTSPEAAMGHAVHEALSEFVSLGTVPVNIAHHGTDDLETYAFLCRNGFKAWHTLKHHFTNMRSEELLESDIATGTADVVHHDGVTAAVLDWKTGWEQKDYKAQLMAYAYALRERFGMPESGIIVGVVVWLRHGNYDVWEFTSDDLDGFKARMLAASERVGKEYAPGAHCTYCPRRNECQARADHLKQCTAMVLSAPADLAQPATLAMAYSRVKELKAAIAQYDAALREALQAGPIVLPGQSISLEQFEKDEIDARKAWPILSDHGFTEDDIAACVKMTKKTLMDIAGRKAARGAKESTRAALLDNLRGAGAITKSIEWRIRERHE